MMSLRILEHNFMIEAEESRFYDLERHPGDEDTSGFQACRAERFESDQRGREIPYP